MAQVPVIYDSAGDASASGDTTPITLGYPATQVEGGVLLALILVKGSSATVTPPSADWTEDYSSGSLGTGTPGTGVGTLQLRVLRRTIPAGGLNGTLDFTIGNTPNSYIGRMLAFHYDATGYGPDVAWSALTGTTYTRTVASTTFGGTGAANLSIADNDYVVFASLSPDDQSSNHDSNSNCTITATGVTLGTPTKLGTSVTTTGGDTSIFIMVAEATAGTESAAPVVANLTSNSSETGGGVFIRVAATGTELQEVSQTKDSAWAIDAQVEATKTSAWNVKATVADSTKTSAWDVLTTVADKTADSAWDVLAERSQTTDTAWQVDAAVEQTKDSSWVVAATVEQTTDSAWYVDAQAEQTKDSAWNVEAPSGTTPVEQTHDVAWQVYTTAIWHAVWTVVTGTAITSGQTISTITTTEVDHRVAVVRGYEHTTDTIRGDVTVGWSYAGTPTTSTSGADLVAGDLVVGTSASIEAVATGDADTLNGDWESIVGVATSGAEEEIAAAVQGKVVDATGVQTFNPTSTGDAVIALFGLVPVELFVVEQTVDAAWNVEEPGAGTVTATKATAWSIDAQVEQTADVAWVVHATVDATADTAWDVLTVVGQTKESAWNIEGRPQREVDSAWNIEGRPQREVGVAWDVLSERSQTKAAAWNVHAEVDATKATAWAIDAQAQQTVDSAWNIEGRPQQTRSTAWNIDAQVEATKATAWDVRTTVEATTDAAWEIHGLVQQTAGTAWQIDAQVAATRATAWIVRQTIEQTADAAWNVWQFVEQTADAAWAIDAQVTGTANTAWDIAMPEGFLPPTYGHQFTFDLHQTSLTGSLSGENVTVTMTPRYLTGEGPYGVDLDREV